MASTVAMSPSSQTNRPRTAPSVIVGRVLTGIALAFLTFDVSMKLFQVKEAISATLLTAYLGGAVAIYVQLENPVFTHMLSPVYVAMFIWGGLYLRDARVRASLGPTR